MLCCACALTLAVTAIAPLLDRDKECQKAVLILGTLRAFSHRFTSLFLTYFDVSSSIIEDEATNTNDQDHRRFDRSLAYI